MAEVTKETAVVEKKTMKQKIYEKRKAEFERKQTMTFEEVEAEKKAKIKSGVKYTIGLLTAGLGAYAFGKARGFSDGAEYDEMTAELAETPGSVAADPIQTDFVDIPVVGSTNVETF